MKIFSDISVTVRITMTLNEARWLKDAMNKPQFGESLESESEIDRVKRTNLRDLLKSESDNHA